MNQSEKNRVNVLENVIYRQFKKNRRRTLSTFIGKRDKPEFEKILLHLIWRKFLSNNEIFIGEIQEVTDKIPEKFHCNPKKFQREEVVGVVLMREEKAFSEERKKLQVAPNCAALNSPKYVFCSWVPLSRCYRTKVMERC